MNARTPNATQHDVSNSSTSLLLEVETPQTSAFEEFDTQFDASLLELELRFNDFVTRSSLANSIGR